MTTRLSGKTLAAGLLFFLFSVSALNAQLNQLVTRIFDNILGAHGALTPVPVYDSTGHLISLANHFLPAADSANIVFSNALAKLMANNMSSFPLGSTSAGLEFDFRTGRPVAVRRSLGPIFAETGKTLGRGRVNVGMNYSYLNLAKFRGIRTNDIHFNLVHEDIGASGLGDIVRESDILVLNLDIDVNANIFALYTTVGLTNNLDLSVALPVINIKLAGSANAIISSFTLIQTGIAYYHFGGPGPNSNEPLLEYHEPFADQAFGIGDMAIRLKYAFHRKLPKPGTDLAVLLDVRLPTGDEEIFFGTGAFNVRFSGIASRKFDNFTPHINVGYEYRGAEFDSDELEFAAGFDQTLVRGLTFALDVMGEIDLNKNEVLTFEYDRAPIVIKDQIRKDGEIIGTSTRLIDQTNIPSRDNDNVFNVAIGFRYAPVENFNLLGNILLPLNDGGLRSDIAYTVGFAFNF